MLQQRHILYLASLLMDMSIAAGIFAICRRAAERGATAAQLGLLGGAWIGAYAAFALLTGRFSDRVGRRRVAVIGCVIVATMSLACAFTTRIGLLVMLTIVFGVGMASFWPSVIAWLGEGLSGPALSARLAKFSVAWNLGLLLGFAYAGALYQWGPQYVFYVSAATAILIAALLLLPAKRAEDSINVKNAMIPPVPAGRGFRKTAWLANFAINFATGGTAALFPQLATTLRIGPEVHSGLQALGRGAALTAFIALNALGFWRTRLWPLWIAQLVCAASIVWIGVADVTWMFAGAWIVSGAVSGYTYQASIFFTLEEMTEKGKGSGFHEAMVGSGMFLGPLLAGWYGDSRSLRAPYFFCAVSLAALIAAQMALVFWRRRASVRP